MDAAKAVSPLCLRFGKIFCGFGSLTGDPNCVVHFCGFWFTKAAKSDRSVSEGVGWKSLKEFVSGSVLCTGVDLRDAAALFFKTHLILKTVWEKCLSCLY